MVKEVERVEVIPHDYEDLQHHCHELEEELESIKRRPPKVETKVVKEI